MFNETAKSTDSVAAALVTARPVTEGVGAGGVFTVKCYDKDGNLKWEEQNHNLVMNVGLQDMNTKYFAGSAYTAAWYMGLVTGPGSGTTFAAADTLASHSGWTEYTNYSGSRPLVSWGSATTADPSVIASSAVQFTISGGGGTVAGAFLCTVASGTSGILFSASDFTGGDRAVVASDILNVTYTFSLDAV